MRVIPSINLNGLANIKKDTKSDLVVFCGE